MAKAVGDYLDSTRATSTIAALLQNTEETVSTLSKSARIRARTARRWLKKMGFSYKDVKKGVYVDGHERDDVKKYRTEVFLKIWKKASRRFLLFKEDGSWEIPPGLQPGEKPLVLVTHDESTFNANDGKRRLWMKENEQPLRPKGKGKGIMVSGFLTPGGVLKVPQDVSDAQLLSDSTWPKNEQGEPVRSAIEYLEYGKDNYWTGEKMVKHTSFVIKILKYAFPHCEGFFAFDNASNHCAYTPDALIASKMNLGSGGKQPRLRDGWHLTSNQPHSMVFSQDHPTPELRGQPKGIRQVLYERGLWQDYRNDGSRFLLLCPKTKDRSGCDRTLNGECCATTLLQSQPDFKEQKGWLQELVEETGHSVIFYPKFHCELNFIERFWCSAKYYTRENCGYSLNDLCQTIPKAFESIPIATINRFYRHCARMIDAYDDGLQYGTKEFENRVYKNHRQVVDKSKW